MVELRIAGLSVTSADGTALVTPTDIVLMGGSLVALVGPNGAGKTSLVRALAGIAPYAGSAQLDGLEIAALSPLVRARQLAWLPQALPPAWPVTVRDAVALGRFAYGAVPGDLTSSDAQAVAEAMAACAVTALADRRITTLSGGELARVHMARALATDATVLLADEPAAALDLAHQLALMELLHAEAMRGRLVVVVVHDIALAVRWADRIIAMDQGRVVADGSPEKVVTPEFLADNFGVTAAIASRNGKPVVEVLGRVGGP
jgi:iron complex transport system ATP-binding protein